MGCGGSVQEVDILEWRDRVLKLEKTVAELASWTKFKQQENNGTAEDPFVNVVASVTPSVNLSESTAAVNNANVQIVGNQEEGTYILHIVEKIYENKDEQMENDRIDDLPEGTSSDYSLPPPILKASTIELQEEIVGCRKPPGNGSDATDVVDEEVMSQETTDDDSSCIFSVESISSIELQDEVLEYWNKPPTPPTTDVVDQEENSQRMITADDEIIEVWVDGYNENDEQVNAEGIHDPHGTSDDLPPILEAQAVSSIQLQLQDDNTSDDGDDRQCKVEHESDCFSNDNSYHSVSNEPVSSIKLRNGDDEDLMSSLTVENDRDVVHQGLKNYEGVIPLPIIIKTEKIWHGEVSEAEDGIDSLAEGPPKSAKKQNKKSRKKFPTAKKTSFRRLPSKSTKIPSTKKPHTAIKTKSSRLKPSVSLNRRIPSTKKQNTVKSTHFKCPHCSKICISKYQLAMHIRSHTNERPFLCPHCPLAMTQAGNLKGHIRKCHPEKNQNFLSCEICHKKFSFPGSLKMHMKIHEAKSNHATHTATTEVEVLFKCPHCDYETAWESRLKTHISNKHPNSNAQQPSQKVCGRPLKKNRKKKQMDGQFRCYFCSYSTKYYWSLVSHVRIHTGEKPFNCPHCPYSSNQEGALKKHCKTHH